MGALRDYFAQLPTKEFKKGEVIFFQGEKPSCGYGVSKGVVRVYNLTRAGEQKCISYYINQDTFPNCWLFSKTDEALYYYQAHTDCELVTIDKTAFHDRLKQDSQLAYEVLQESMGAYVQLMMRVNSLEQPRASTKLLSILQLLCLRYGGEMQKDVVKINLPLTQQEIADFSGLTRETTTVELKRLRNAGVIVPDKKYYVVKTDLLNEQLDDEFNPGIHIEN